MAVNLKYDVLERRIGDFEFVIYWMPRKKVYRLAQIVGVLVAGRVKPSRHKVRDYDKVEQAFAHLEMLTEAHAVDVAKKALGLETSWPHFTAAYHYKKG